MYIYINYAQYAHWNVEDLFSTVPRCIAFEISSSMHGYCLVLGCQGSVDGIATSNSVEYCYTLPVAYLVSLAQSNDQ